MIEKGKFASKMLYAILLAISNKENSPIGEPARRRQRRSCTYTVFLKIAAYARTSPALQFYTFLTVQKEANLELASFSFQLFTIKLI